MGYIVDMLLAGIPLNTCICTENLFEASLKSQIPNFKNIMLEETKAFSADLFKTVKSEELYRDTKHGFYVSKEYTELCPKGHAVAYNLKGEFIGTPEFAVKICIDRGILPETYDNNTVCSIGFNAKDQAWYGWSHRAFSFPFKIGYKIVNNDDICTGCFGPNEESLPVGFVAKNLDDCKKLAIAYASSVS